MKPTFVDVLEEDLTIDPAAVEKAISANTSAILATHVYGSVCNLEALFDAILPRWNYRAVPAIL